MCFDSLVGLGNWGTFVPLFFGNHNGVVEQFLWKWGIDFSPPENMFLLFTPSGVCAFL